MAVLTMVLLLPCFSQALSADLTLPRHRSQAGQHDVAATGPGATTPWRHGRLLFDVPGVVQRSNIVLARPNLRRTEFMPLGNGRLGAALWSADGMTVQLNRADTFPERKSPGQLVIPALKKLVNARDYRAHLDIYNGWFKESGGGMTATAYIRADADELVVSVTGAGPAIEQQVEFHLWQPRQSSAHASAGIATLEDSWKDQGQPGASGRDFGTLAALGANARRVRASVVDGRVVQLSFLPRRDGSFSIIVAAPHGFGADTMARARRSLSVDLGKSGADLRRAHLAWWHDFWHRVGLMKLSSSDGVAQYMENLRAIHLYVSAAEDRSRFPGSQAGVADLFFFNKDQHRWNPAAFWQWNLRMLVGANLGAGAFDLNQPYFRLYRDNLAALKAWTLQHMGGRPGICIPETMRFNGNGFDYQKTARGVEIFSECDASVPAAWNARTVSTGAEVSLWIWRQYLATGDRRFLAQNYPVMAASTQFLLSWMRLGPDDRLHSEASNAHETQWDVRDPTTNIAAMRTLFPVVIQAARLLHRDRILVRRLQAAMPHILPFPRSDAAAHRSLLTAAADAAGTDVIGPSYEPAAKRHNIENIGLEPVWPYELSGSSDAELALARRTFAHRVTRDKPEWSEDAVDAARLGLPDAVRNSLIAITQAHQLFPSGLAGLFGSKRSPQFGTHSAPYVEQLANVALTLQQALVQVDDGVLEVARAWPHGWNAKGTVFIAGRSAVSVQIRDGAVIAVGIAAGSNRDQAMRNPWPGQRIQVWAMPGKKRFRTAAGALQPGGAPSRLPFAQDARAVDVRVAVARGTRTLQQLAATTSNDQFFIPLRRGMAYRVQRVAPAAARLPFAPVSGQPASAPKTLGPVSIGLSSAMVGGGR